MDQKETDDFEYFCTSEYANIVTKECVCKYIPRPGSNPDLFGHVPDEDLVLNPNYLPGL